MSNERTGEMDSWHMNSPEDARFLPERELARLERLANPRSVWRLKDNSPAAVEAITGEAFASADPAHAVQTLCGLYGVGVRVGSAVLMVFDPTQHTVLDERAWNTLKILGLLEPLGLSDRDGQLDNPATHGAYVEACRQLARDAEVSLRTLDRCLWTIDERRLHSWARSGTSFDPFVDGAHQG